MDLTGLNKIRCENCQAILEVEEELYGQEARCPDCENLIYVPLPELGGAGLERNYIEKHERPEYKKCPACNSELPFSAGRCDICGIVLVSSRREPEGLIWTGEPSWYQYAGVVLAALFGSVLLCLASGAAVLEGASPICSLSLLISTLAALLIAFPVAAFSKFSREYTITNKRVMIRKGVFWKNEVVVNINNIDRITLKQSYFQKLLHIGDIRFESRDQAIAPIVFRGIEKPEQVREKIFERIDLTVS